MKKKSISLLLVFTLIFTSVSMHVFAEEQMSDLDVENIFDSLQILDSTVTASPEAEDKIVVPAVSPEIDNSNNGKNEEITLFAENTTNLNAQLVSGSYTIEANGQYELSTNTNYGIIVKSGVTADLTLIDASITTTGAAPIKVESGAVLKLHIKGTNTLTAPNYYAGIAVYANDIASNYGTLIIDGDGVLNVNGGATHGAGIGTNKRGTDGNTNGIHGKIVINSGTINAAGGSGGAGIGSSYNCVAGCAIEITGGIINATGGSQAAGIGGSGANPNGPITITGGSVIATSGSGIAYGIGQGRSSSSAGAVVITGGSVNAAVSPKCPPTDKSGTELHQLVLQMPGGTAMANKEVTVGAWKATTDANGKLYPYVSNDTTSFAAEYNGKVYYTKEITSENFEYTLTEYDGPSCSCTTENSSVTLDIESITVNKLVGSNSVRLASTFHTADNCTYPIHSISTEYELTIDGGEADNSLAQISGGYLEVYYAAVGKTLHVSVTSVMDGKTYTDEKDIPVTGSDKTELDISDGSIVISPNSSDSSKMNVTQGSVQYTVLKSSTVNIKQSGSTTSNTITVQGVDAKVAIENVNIRTDVTNPITIGDNINLTLELIGSNTINAQNTSAVQGILSTSQMTIEGEGSLDIESGIGAGIGNIKTLTVNGGTIVARGGNDGAGIGGGKDGEGREVIINDGRVYAYGSGNAAGIGGGASQSAGGGGSFTINGGMVFAESAGSGKGIGYGGKTNAPGTITINGGSVNADLALRPANSGSNQYLVKLNIEGVSGQKAFTYTIGDDDSKPIPVSTDENGQMYLYLPTGRQWIRVVDVVDGEKTTYYCYKTVQADDTNDGTCTANPVARLTKFEVAGQVEEAEIDQNNLTVTVTVPYNIMLDRITPIVQYEGCDATSGALNFDNSEHTATFTVYSDDKKSKDYTVKMILANEPDTPQADEYDISKGNIVITGSYVRYGGTYYVTNSNGYVITGSTTENNISIDYAEQDLPQIIMKDVNMNFTSQTVPVRVSESVNIKIEGVCNISSVSTRAIETSNSYGEVNLNIIGNGVLNIKGGGLNPAVYLASDTAMSITGAATSIIGGTGQNALDGTGEFITDSTTAMRIDLTENPVIQPRNANGTLLYQLTAHIQAKDKTADTCTYNNKSYYVWDNATLYLMVPDNEYSMTVTYDSFDYDGKVTVNGTPAEVNLSTISVDNVAYDNTTLPYKGGTVEFTVTGHLVADNVIIRLKPNDDTLEIVEGTVKEVDGENKVSITLPENTSYDKAVTYTVYYVIRDNETELNRRIQVDRNNTDCSITGFTIENQVGETSFVTSGTSTNLILITMPYDDEFEEHKYYTASITSSRGSTVSPAAGPAQFTLDVNGYMRARYTVTAEDKVTTKTYEVRLSKSPTQPQIQTLTIQGTPTSDGGKITVTARGIATNSIQYAANPDNRNVYIYADGIEPVKAEMQMVNDVAQYVAEIDMPKNTSDTEDAVYTLKARIGSTEQTGITSNTTVTVPRQKRGVANIKSFSITGQVGETSFVTTGVSTNLIQITMPYDADLTSLSPNIMLEDLYASYSPLNAHDFTSGVEYTVTAENGTRKNYTVRVDKQETPVVSGISFTNPSSSGAGRVSVTVIGQHLENAANAMNSSKHIQVTGTLTSGDSSNSGITPANAVLDSNGNYVASIVVPTNNSYEPRTYTLQVVIGGKVQTLTGNVTLTVPAKTPDSNDITDIIIAENQDEIVFSDNNTIIVTVPYNTDLRNVIPVVYHNGVSYTPQGAVNFSNPVPYTVTAENGDKKTYTVTVQRKGTPKIESVTVKAPAHFKDTKITADINGQFIPYLTDGVEKDVITISAVSRDDNSVISGTVEYDSSVYAGHASGIIQLPVNDGDTDKVYDIKVYINNNEQTDVSCSVTVPHRKACQIMEFKFPDNLQTGDTRIEGTDIYIEVPYIFDITSVTPVIMYDADTITPEGAQDFSDLNNPVRYTLTSGGDESVTYTVHIIKLGEDPKLTSMTVENQTENTVYGAGNTVKISLPSGSNLESIEPVIEFTGVDYSPKGAQNFTNSTEKPVEYTFVNEYGIEKKYYVTISIKQEEKKKSGSSRSRATPKPTATPTAIPTDEPIPTVPPIVQEKTKPYMNGYEEDGLLIFKPDNTITRAEVATILTALDDDFDAGISYPDIFSDMNSDDWYKNYVNFAVYKDYIAGYDDKTCRPMNMITRAEFTAVIARYIDIVPNDSEDRFNDIADISWCRHQINTLADMGIISGYDNGEFRPNDMITRAEVTSIVNRALGRKITNEILMQITCPFNDITSSHWAYNDVLMASCEY